MSINDSTLQFIITTLIAITAAILPFILYFWKQQRSKELIYRIMNNTPVVKVSDEFKENLKVTFKRTRVQDLRLIQIKFTNLGNVEIKSIDYEKPINIIFEGNKTKLLVCDVVETEPKGLQINLEITNNQVTILPTLLNGGDTFTLKILISNFSKELIKVDGRISGIKEIRRVTKERTDRDFAKSFIVKIPIYIGRFIFDLFGRLDAGETSAVIMGWLVIVVSILLITGIIDVNYWKTLWRFFFPQP